MPAHLAPGGPWFAIRYRVGQFFNGLAAEVSPEEVKQATCSLPAAAADLFRSMPLDAQRHSLDVLYSLQSAGRVQPDLAAAALLHDVGKLAAEKSGLRLGLWVRGPLVLLESFAPHRLTRMASSQVEDGWRYLVYVHLEHPRIGAEMAQRAGCTHLTCWLIEHHQSPPDPADSSERSRLLTALKWADSQH